MVRFDSATEICRHSVLEELTLGCKHNKLILLSRAMFDNIDILE